MTREPEERKPPRRAQSGGRGRGGPPPGIPYGGQARSVYTPPTRTGDTPSSAAGPDKAATPSESATRKTASSRSRYGSIAPGKRLVPGMAPLFGREMILRLQAPAGGDSDEWAVYASEETAPGGGGRSVVKGVQIDRSWLPDPLPERLKVRFRPA